MSKKLLITLICILSVVLMVEVAFLVTMSLRPDTIGGDMDRFEPTTSPTRETDPTQTTEEPTSEPTEEPTSEPTEDPTEPGPETHVLTFVGDCTLASAPNHYNNASGFIKTIGENYDYPFAKVRQYFENDDFTMINLENVLADSGAASDKTFTFRGPTAYTNILTGSSVEAVTLANNHTQDYGKDGYASTTNALTNAGVAYVETNGTLLYKTDRGLTIGVYAACFTINEQDMRNDIAALRASGADIVVAALHWGNEGKYRPNTSQIDYGRIAIDAGADIVYGHHPHVLQRIENYKNGIILYSLGNFCFGGNSNPRDKDSVIVQFEIIRDENGKVRLEKMNLIPVSISGVQKGNDFQPTPLEPGTEAYDRVMSKLNGSFNGPDLEVDYSDLEKPPKDDPTEPTEPSEPTPPEGGDGGNTGGDGGSDPVPTPDPTPTPPADSAPEA